MSDPREPDDRRLDQLFSDVLRRATSALAAPELRAPAPARRLRVSPAAVLALALPVLFIVLLAALLARQGTTLLLPAGKSTLTPSVRIVPWIATEPSPSPPPPSPTPPARICRAGDLSVGAFAGAGAAAGTAYYPAVLGNSSGSSCSLDARATAQFFYNRQPVGTSMIVTNLTTTNPYVTVNPPPGTPEANLVIAVTDVCVSAPVTDLVITFPQGGGQLSVHLGAHISPSPPPGGGCSAPLPPTAFWSQPGEPVALPGPSPLQATIDAPATAHPGEHLRYLVRLTNPTNATVTLKPCPAYTEGLKGVNGTVHTYLLNCAAVESIRAGETVTFEMFIDVPASPLPLGGGPPYLLNWGGDIGGAGPYAAVDVAIEP